MSGVLDLGCGVVVWVGLLRNRARCLRPDALKKSVGLGFGIRSPALHGPPGFLSHLLVVLRQEHHVAGLVRDEVLNHLRHGLTPVSRQTPQTLHERPGQIDREGGLVGVTLAGHVEDLNRCLRPVKDDLIEFLNLGDGFAGEKKLHPHDCTLEQLLKFVQTSGGIPDGFPQEPLPLNFLNR